MLRAEWCYRPPWVLGCFIVDFTVGPWRAEAELTDYFAGRLEQFDLPLDLRGTEFQRSVWEALRGIPYGETRT
ncbi:MAG: methylated-DNA--[protein]-cysteine S-methyltransferase, partial [Gemmatimonadales bacterium]